MEDASLTTYGETYRVLFHLGFKILPSVLKIKLFPTGEMENIILFFSDPLINNS